MREATFKKGSWTLFVECDDESSQAYLEWGGYTSSLACAQGAGIVTNYDGDDIAIPKYIVDWATTTAVKFGY